MNELTVIIPIDKFNEEVSTLLTSAISSVEEGTKLILVGPHDTLEATKSLDVVKNKKNLKFLDNENINLPTQINLAVNEVKTKYFSVLEYDDTFTPNWFKNVAERIESEPGVFAYLPIYEVFTYGDDTNAIGYVNEPVWASSFSEKIGYFDTESLENYVDIGCSGALFDKDTFIELGGLKESMKVSFWYEFMLRADYKSKKIYVVPKVGYRHCLGRPGSLLEIYKQTLTSEEATWWIALAKQEHFFKKDRNKTYKK